MKPIFKKILLLALLAPIIAVAQFQRPAYFYHAVDTALAAGTLPSVISSAGFNLLRAKDSTMIFSTGKSWVEYAAGSRYGLVARRITGPGIADFPRQDTLFYKAGTNITLAKVGTDTLQISSSGGAASFRVRDDGNILTSALQSIDFRGGLQAIEPASDSIEVYIAANKGIKALADTLQILRKASLSGLAFTNDSVFVNITGLPGLLADAQKVAVRKNAGAVVGTRQQLNLIEGSNVTLTVTDDAVTPEIDITIAAAGGAVSGVAQYGDMYITENATPLALTQDTWTRVIGFTSGTLSSGVDFTLNGMAVDSAGAYEISFSLSVSANSLDTLTAAIYVNATRIGEHKVKLFSFSQGLITATMVGAINFAHSLAVNDTVRLYIANLTSGDDPTIQEATVSIRQIVSGGIVSGGAPTTAQYVTMALDGTLTQERVLTEGNYLDVTDGGANGSATVAMDPTELGTATWNAGTDFTWTFNTAGTATNDPIIAFSSENLTLHSRTINFGDGTNTTTPQVWNFNFPATANDMAFQFTENKFTIADADNDFVFELENAFGGFSFASINTSNDLDLRINRPSGTSGTHTFFIGNQGAGTMNVEVDGAVIPGELRLRESSGTDYLGFRAPTALAATTTYLMPRKGSATTGMVLHINATQDSLYWDTDDGAGGGAPVDATYITQTANGTLTQEQALGALASGMLASTTTTGVVAARTLTGTAGAVTVTSGDGSGNPTFTLPATVTVPTVYAIGTDPADAGVLRLENAAIIGWEASPAGTDVTLTVDASEIMQASGTFNAVTLTESANAVPNSTDHLGFFAATTSAQLAGVLSDESGAAGVFPRFSLTTPAQGDVVYYNGTNWVNLAPGTSGQVLHTQGAGANVIWDADDGAGGGAPIDATYITQTANGTLTQEQALGALATGVLSSTTTTGVVASRILTGTTGAIDITNGNGSANPTFTLPATVTVPTVYAIGADPADAGAIRLVNAAVIGWEASPASTDITLSVDASEIMQSSVTFNAPTLTEGANAVPNATDNLSFFAATTSAQLAGVLSDESGAAGVFPRFSLTTPAQGDVIYYNGTNWVNLAPGISGQVLHTQGATANPIWDTDDGAGGGAPIDATYITQTSNGTLTQEQALGALATGVLASTTTTGVIASRILTGTTGAITVTNGDGSGNPTFTLPAAITVPTSYAIGADPADAGVIRLESAAVIGWEASPAGTDITLTVDANEIMQASGTFNAATLTEGTNAVPNATDHLGFFAATTSAQLAGVLSDESGAAGVFPRFSLTSAAQGDIIFYNGTSWVNLAPGVSGQVLHTQGASANPVWNTDDGAGGAAATEPFVTIGNTAGLSAERALTESTNGIDIADGGANSTVTISFDPTEVGTVTWGSGSGFTWTFNASAGTDPTIIPSDGAFSLGNSNKLIIQDETGFDYSLYANLKMLRLEAADAGALEFRIVNTTGPDIDLNVFGTVIGRDMLEGTDAVPNATDNLSFFASTTSAQLAGVLSDETGGAGVAVFNSNPTLAGATVSGGNLSFSDGSGDSPTATFTPATGTAWSLFGQDTDDDFQILSASTAATENVDILNPGAGTATLTVEGAITGSNLSGTNTGDQTITLQGDVTGSGTGTFTTTIADNAVDGTDIALGSDAQGDVMYYNGTDWARLAAGTSGQFLQTLGIGANPQWAATTGASTSEPFITIGNTAGLSAERALTAGNYIDITDGGANSTATVAMDPTEVGSVTWGTADATWTFDATTGNNPTLAWTTESMTLTSDLALKQVTGDVAYLGFFENAANGTDVIAIGAPLSITTSYTMNWPPAQASGNKFLKNNGTGGLSWSTVDLSAAAEVTNSLGIANGGTGLNSTPTNGQLLIGNGSGYTLAALTEGNYLDIANGSGSISLAFDPTEILQTTWADNSNSSYLWLFNTNAADTDDPSVTWRGGSGLGSKSMRLDDAMAIDLFAGSTMWTLLPNSPSASMLAIRTSFAGTATLAIANDSATNSTTVDIDGGLTAGGSITEGGNAVPNATDNLSFFASTTSAQLAGVLSNETGSGLAVFGTSPTLDNPDIKVNQGANTKALTESSATNFVQISVASESYVGGTVYYTIFAFDGVDQIQSRSGQFNFTAVNLAGGEVVTIGTVINEAYASLGGTLTVSFTASTTPTNGFLLQANAVSSLSQTTLEMKYRISINGTATVTPQ